MHICFCEKVVRCGGIALFRLWLTIGLTVLILHVLQRLEFFFSLNEAYATSGFAWVHLFVQREEIRCCCCCCHFFRFVVCLYLSINSAHTWKMVRNANVIGDLWWSDVKAFLYSFIARAWAQLHCSVTFVQCVFIESRAEKKKRSLIFRTPWVRMQSNGLCRHLTS